jgi:hypothetical protein
LKEEGQQERPVGREKGGKGEAFRGKRFRRKKLDPKKPVKDIPDISVYMTRAILLFYFCHASYSYFEDGGSVFFPHSESGT